MSDHIFVSSVRKVRIPMVPNYVVVCDSVGEGSIDIADLSEQSFDEVCNAWLKAVRENRTKRQVDRKLGGAQ